MEDKVKFGKLFHFRQLALLLEDFALLLGPQAVLAVSDRPDRLSGDRQYPPDRVIPPETVTALWQAASDAADVVISSQGAAVPLCLESQRVGLIVAVGELPPAPQTRAVLTTFRHTLEALAQVALEKRAVTREALDRYREVNLLYSLGETLTTCLDMDELVQLTLTEASQIIQAQCGIVLLYDEAQELVPAASTGEAANIEVVATAGEALAKEVAETGKPQIANGGEHQIPLLAVPLLTTDRHLGVILLAGKKGIFTAGDEKLLTALAWQAAIALENARLFEDVRQQRDEIAMMKRYMDYIFASIASGVITTDNQDIITTFNRAAETILRIPAYEAVNRPCTEALRFLRHTSFPQLVQDVKTSHKAYVSREIAPRLPQGGRLYLNMSISLLQGRSAEETLGVAIVFDDVTEKQRYERERAVVRRYLPAGLVDRLPHDMTELGLAGERRLITTLFADIRGFTSFSEINPPERVVDVLNRYFTLSEAAVRFNWGIVDKYMGDAILALFNTPLLEQKQHAWRAVHMAWVLNQAIATYHDYLPPDERLGMGFGISTGIVVVGNVGAEDRMEYTVVGDTVNLARRLQENAQPGQILISHETWELVRDQVEVNILPAMRLKGRRSFTRVYEVVSLGKTSH
ncbi:MAG TPA: GAF domain-containing protein [Chloroflexi bacterium]|nr:GAF domain-containing protein [Chloroflexota bacterium]